MDPDSPQKQEDTQKLEELKKQVSDLESKADQTGGQPTQPAVVPPPQVPSTPVTTTPDQKKKSSPVIWIVVILFVLALLALGGYIVYTRGLFSLGRKEATGPVVTVTPTQAVDETAGWQLYTNSEIGFSIKHPNDVEVNEDSVNKSVSLVKFGATQVEGTEFYDGISLSIKAGSLSQMSLKQFVDTVGKDDPAAEVVSGPEAITVAGMSGYKLTVSGLGEFDYYYFPKGADGYLEVVDYTQDPGQTGFAETVTLIMESLTVISTTPTPTTTASPSASPGI
jgi:hypothetical protein